MADPYNHNPFSTDNGDRELRSEYAANKALGKAIANQLNKLLPDLVEALDYDPWKELKND